MPVRTAWLKLVGSLFSVCRQCLALPRAAAHEVKRQEACSWGALLGSSAWLVWPAGSAPVPSDAINVPQQRAHQLPLPLPSHQSPRQR